MVRSLQDIMKDIQSMSDASITKDLFAMLYSEFGMGKTTTTMGLAQALRGEREILFLDSSDGWVALEEFPALLEGADRFQVKDPKDIVVIANGFVTGKLSKYSVLVIDELSSIYDAMVEQYLREKHNLTQDEQIPEAEGQDYGPPTAAMASFLRKLQEVDGLHLIVTAHAREVQAKGDAKEIRASFPPKAFAEVMRRTHVTAALSARRRRVPGSKELSYERTLQLKPSSRVSAKSRIRNSPITAAPDEFIELVTNWLESDEYVADTQHAAEETELVEDIEPSVEPIEQDDVSILDDATDESISDIVDNVLGTDTDEEAAEKPEGLHLRIYEELPTKKERIAQLQRAKVTELREFIESEWDIDTTGLKKAQLIDGVISMEYPDDEPEEQSVDNSVETEEAPEAEEPVEDTPEEDTEGTDQPTEDERRAELEGQNIFQLRALVDKMFKGVNSSSLDKEEIIEGVIFSEYHQEG